MQITYNSYAKYDMALMPREREIPNRPRNTVADRQKP